MPGWTFADVWGHIAALVPDAPALVHDGDRRSWREFHRRAGGVAAWLTGAGVQRGETVAQYLYNSNEYLESFFACSKAGLVPVNTNYRYVEDELVYLWDNAEAAAVVFHGVFADRIEGLRARVPVRLWLWVDDGSGPCPEWAVPYEDAAAAAPTSHERDGDDLILIYTGGTTGLPKGVMWRQDDLYNSFSQSVWKDPIEPDLDAVTARVTKRLGPVALPACPLMHGTGLYVALQQLSQAGSVVTTRGRRFDVEELLDTISAERVNIAAIVGDVFSKPVLAALDAHADRWDISSLKILVSSGALWSAEVKQALLAHLPKLTLIDMFASSEAAGMGQSVVRGGAASPDGRAKTARFTVGPNTRVITEDGRDVVPGSGEVGLVAAGGFQPLGYFKDPEKSAATFRIVDGRRYSIPGDHATVEADGTLTFLGRGSSCINTGGEKVYPEEVEDVLLRFPGVRDAVVVGVPDDRFGEAVTALIEGEVDEDALVTHARQHLAAYKTPKHLLVVPSVDRAANGKVDRRALRQRAISYIS